MDTNHMQVDSSWSKNTLCIYFGSSGSKRLWKLLIFPWEKSLHTKPVNTPQSGLVSYSS